jgi:hypothetical protein
MHSLQVAPISCSEMNAITADAAAGSAVASARNPVARRSPCRPESAISPARKRRNANTDIAASEIGIPPHVLARKNEE